MSELNVGDYVRTINGEIYKLIDDFALIYFQKEQEHGILEHQIIKSSPNIIDLIEVGDYVNGCPVLHKENNELVCGLLLRYKEENIQNVVTKEQFSSMMYKVGE